MPRESPASTARSVPMASRTRSVKSGHDRIYAIGDLHGRADLFATMLRTIQTDGRTRGANSSTRIVILGDLIDRGPCSRELLALVRRFVASDFGVVALRGNHEDMLVRAAGGSRPAQRAWLRNGGVQTLASFGFAPDCLKDLSAHDCATSIRDAVGQGTIDWLQALPTHFTSGDYFFCHAGVRPGIALDRQAPRDLMWIGDEFVRSTVDHGAVIVHGHTECREPEIRSNRINVDTGAYRTGKLSAIGLEGVLRWSLAAQGPAMTDRNPARMASASPANPRH